MRASPGSTLLEFAVAWPIFLIAVLGSIQLSIWSVEVLAVRSAAVAGARAATAAGSGRAVGSAVAVRSLQPFLAGTRAAAWCPGDQGRMPAVWICSAASAGSVEVRVGGAVPALVPLVGGLWLPVGADVILSVENSS